MYWILLWRGVSLYSLETKWLAKVLLLSSMELDRADLQFLYRDFEEIF